MRIDLLGNDFRYALAPYERSRAGYLGDEIMGPPSSLMNQPEETRAERLKKVFGSLGDFANKLVDVAPGVVDSIVDAKIAEANSQAEIARLNQIRELKKSGGLASIASGSFDMQSAMPWLIGGGVVLVAVIFMMGTRKRRR